MLSVNLNINIYDRQAQTSLDTLGLDLTPSRKPRLATRIRNMLSSNPLATPFTGSISLQWYVDYFGEQVTVDAWRDIERYFSRLSTAGITLGGLPTGSAPLAIAPSHIRPSNTAISVIAEGLAGWHLQRQHLLPFSRPIGTPVDLVFQIISGGAQQFALVQVKGTQGPGVRDQLQKAMLELLDYGFKVAARSHDSYACYVVGVIIKPNNSLEIYSLRLDLV